MNAARFHTVTDQYPRLRIAIAGDFCLDRYFEIDPAKQELSIETGLPVHNVARVRCQPGGAGTILNNLVALGVGCLYPLGIAGQDGEGWSLLRALRGLPGVKLDHFIQSPERQTFTYSKPLLMHPNAAPEELGRLDCKNWTPTPAEIEDQMIRSLRQLAGQIDALILLEQVDVANTGVLTTRVLEAIGQLSREHPRLLILADSRRGLAHFPPVTFKMNRAELGRLLGDPRTLSLMEVQTQAAALARKNRRAVIVSLAEQGIAGAQPDGQTARVPSLPIRGEIDIVGAGDAVTANLTAALAAGATLPEALVLANAAASIVIHQLGTTGAASLAQLAEILDV